MFKVILFFLLFYFVFRFLFRVLIPALLMRKLRKMSSEMNGGERSNASGGQKEGKVTITYKPTDNSGKDKSKEGEYVDFEEVD